MNNVVLNNNIENETGHGNMKIVLYFCFPFIAISLISLLIAKIPV